MGERHHHERRKSDAESRRTEELLTHHLDNLRKAMAQDLSQLTATITEAVAELGARAALKAENDQLKADAVTDKAAIAALNDQLKAALTPAS
jgi:hypothetical protein